MTQIYTPTTDSTSITPVNDPNYEVPLSEKAAKHVRDSQLLAFGTSADDVSGTLEMLADCPEIQEEIARSLGR